MAGYKADLVNHEGYLSDKFIEELACRKLELTIEELEKVVGRNIRGKRKGMLKGKLIWTKAIRGGWVKTGRYDVDRMQAHGFVIGRNKTFNYKIINAWTGEVLYDERKRYEN